MIYLINIYTTASLILYDSFDFLANLYKNIKARFVICNIIIFFHILLCSPLLIVVNQVILNLSQNVLTSLLRTVLTHYYTKNNIRTEEAIQQIFFITVFDVNV